MRGRLKRGLKLVVLGCSIYFLVNLYVGYIYDYHLNGIDERDMDPGGLDAWNTGGEIDEERSNSLEKVSSYRNISTKTPHNEDEKRPNQDLLTNLKVLLQNIGEVDQNSTSQLIRAVVEMSKARAASQANETSDGGPSYIIIIQNNQETSQFTEDYSKRVSIENVTLPETWRPSRELIQRLYERRIRVRQVCKEYHLDQRSPTNQPNAWEFFIEPSHGLIWCPVFKAASSTWMFNFNILAGYTEEHLMHTKNTPISVARQKYPRPTVEELDAALNSKSRSVSFMISRHPFERLVSAYRDKIESGVKFYEKLRKNIMKMFPEKSPNRLKGSLGGAKSRRKVVPSFNQFVEFIIDSHNKGLKMDEHWTPLHQFCSPCLVDFDVYAKVETLDEDGTYIIFKSGTQDIIHPKHINRARAKPTDAVAVSYFCQLTQSQREGMARVYEIDMQLFEYNFDDYNCSNIKEISPKGNETAPSL